MTLIIGTVRCVRVTPDAAFTTIIERGTGQRETFILWWDGLATPANPPARVRIAQSDWIAILREAWAGNRTVEVSTPGTSNTVSHVQAGET